MKYIVDMNLEVEETMALNVERSNSTNHNFPNSTRCCGAPTPRRLSLSKPSISSPGPRRDETIIGWCVYAFQLVLLPSLLSSVNGLLAHPFSKAEVNFTYFLLNFFSCLWVYHAFLGANFKPVKQHPILFSQAVILGLVAYWVSFTAVTWALKQLDPGYVNQNDASIAAMKKGGYYLMLLGTVVLAPLTEECVFRGLIFRNLWKTSAIAAYLVSMAAFSAVHIVSYIGVYSPLHLVLAFLQYLPAGVWLAWCYTKSGSIFGPIVMHAIINLYSLNLLR